MGLYDGRELRISNIELRIWGAERVPMTRRAIRKHPSSIAFRGLYSPRSQFEIPIRDPAIRNPTSECDRPVQMQIGSPAELVDIQLRGRAGFPPQLSNIAENRRVVVTGVYASFSSLGGLG